MKIIKVYIVSFVLLIAMYFVGMNIISTVGDENMDLSHINEITQRVNEEYGQGSRIFNEDKDYKVILKENDDYLSVVSNAIKQDSVIMDLVYQEKLVGKIIFDKSIRRNEIIKNKLFLFSSIVYSFAIIIMFGVACYTIIYIVKPFQKLKHFATNVAAGNLEIPINRKRNDYFGAFTESFDLMRQELDRARKSEYEANKSKKELVASLSHDIKTPVTTIKAVCEVLEIKMNEDENKEKIKTIATKADQIDHLVTNMFQSTLEDLEVLEIQSKEESSQIVGNTVQDMNSINRIDIQNEVPDCLIWCDKLRTIQVIDNILNNAMKYSADKVHVCYELSEQFLLVRIRDEGDGVPEEDLARICEKFYRGKNAQGKSGSGLGLYLAKTFMEGMNGYLDCYNENGFVVELRFKLV